MLAQRRQGRQVSGAKLPAKPSADATAEGDGGEFQSRKSRLAAQRRILGSSKPDQRIVDAVLKGDKAISASMEVDAFVLGVSLMMEKGSYDQLERLYAYYRDSKERFSSGVRKSTIFFFALKKPRVDGARTAWLPQQLVEWQGARPNSILPRVALARMLMDATEGAWNADVQALPEPLRSYMGDPLTSSRKLLEEAASIAPDADIYALLIDQVRRENGSEEEAQQYLDLADQADGTHYHHEGQYARLLQATGRDWRAAISKPENGYIAIDTYVKNVPAKQQLPYLEAGEKAFPKSAVAKNKIAKAAIKARKYDVAARAFAALGDRCETTVWKPEEFFRERNKLEQMGHKVRTGAFFPLPDNPTEMGQALFGADLLVRQSAELFQREQYAELDAIADAFRSKTARFPDHNRKVTAMYAGFEHEELRKELEPWEVSVMAERWRRLRPGSVLAQTIAIKAAVEEAWAVRGSGWASSVSPSQWDGFHERLDVARAYFDALDAAPGAKDPEAYAEAITIATGTGAERSEVDRLLQKARAVDPLPDEAYGAATNYLLPRWMGSQEELEQFLFSMPPEVLDTAIIVAREDVDIQDKKLRKRILDGKLALAAKHSTSETWSEVLFMAAAAEDRAAGARAVAALNGDWSPNYIMSPKTFKRYVAWTKGGSL